MSNSAIMKRSPSCSSASRSVRLWMTGGIWGAIAIWVCEAAVFGGVSEELFSHCDVRESRTPCSCRS